VQRGMSGRKCLGTAAVVELNSFLQLQDSSLEMYWLHSSLEDPFAVATYSHMFRCCKKSPESAV
jgi:hypothetical protein